MDTLNTIINLMSLDCYMGSLDLKDAYYSIPVMKEHRKYLRFLFNGRLYQFTCLPNGLSSCPRKFTKTLKPILTTLHRDGHIRHILLLRTVFYVGIILQGGHFFTPHKVLFGSKKLNICSRRLTLFTLCCSKG